MRSLAIEKGSITLMILLLELMDQLFSNVVMKDEVYNPKIPVFLLNIQEVCLSYEMNKKVDGESVEEFKNNIKGFYDPIINQGIKTAVNTFYFLIQFFYRRLAQESMFYLKNNAQYLLELLLPITHWEHSLNDKECYEWEKTKFDLLAKYIAYLSILIYKRAVSGELPPEAVREVAFPLIEHCDTASLQTGRGNNKYFDEFIFSHEFNYSFDPQIMNWFETSVHKAGTYTPAYYDFSHFWITLSVYRKSYGQDFLPTRMIDSRGSDWLKHFLQRASEIDLQKLSSITAVDETKVSELLKDYEKHLKSLVNNNPPPQPATRAEISE